MKFYLIAALLLVALATVFAAPAAPEEYEALEEVGEGRADRQRRVTCDLMSFKGVMEHSACAANCLSMGKAGGRCQDGVCVCRVTTFKELWDKRFN